MRDHVYTVGPSGRRTAWAHPDDVAEVATDMAPEHLACRDYKHSWAPYSGGQNHDGTWERTLQCARCLTLRGETLTRTGHVIGGRRYEYPEGYLVPGLGRLGGEALDTVRLTSLMRQMSGSSKPARRTRKAATQ